MTQQTVNKIEENKTQQPIAEALDSQQKTVTPQIPLPSQTSPLPPSQTSPKTPTETKKEKSKSGKKIIKKEEAIAKGIYLHASKKHCMYLCSFIMNKTVDNALRDIEKVIKYKQVVPFKGEIPHRKGKGIMSGRYPINASKLFITLLKGLKGNITTNGLDLDKARIYIASASWAARPARGGGTRGKRAYVIIRAKEFPEIKEKKK